MLEYTDLTESARRLLGTAANDRSGRIHFKKSSDELITTYVGEQIYTDDHRGFLEVHSAIEELKELELIEQLGDNSGLTVSLEGYRFCDRNPELLK